MARSLFQQALGLYLVVWVSLSQSAPLAEVESTALSKRDDTLYDLWNSISKTQIAQGDTALHFTIDQSKTDAWGVTFLYGCTALMISDQNNVLVSHLQEEGATPNCVQLDDATSVNKYITNVLEPALDLFDPKDGSDGDGVTSVDFLFAACYSNAIGINLIKSYLTNDPTTSNSPGWGLPANQWKQWPYQGSSATGEPSPNQPQGLAVVQWEAPSTPPAATGNLIGTLEVYFGSAAQDDPIRGSRYYVA